MIAATPGAVGISRWLAPELINPPRKKGYRQPAGTEQADIFAFAMLGIEIFTGELPFGDTRHETAILMIAQGQRPEKPRGAEPRGFTSEIWRFTQRCWHQNPTKRPKIDAVVTTWRGFESQEKWVTYQKAYDRLLILDTPHRLRGSTLVSADIHQEKHQPRSHKPFTKSTGELSSLQTRSNLHLNPT